MLKAASCFSGIGAPELGGPQFEWLWHAEIEKFPSAVMDARFPDSVNLGDVTADDFLQRASAFGKLDMLVGGPPCQDFSVAGLRAGVAGDRGNLSLRFMEIAHAIRPRNLLVENVPGWLNMPDNAFGCFLGALVGADDALRSPLDGKWPGAGMVAGPRARAAWRVFDAQYFGVAQRRRRVFVVADFGEGADPAAVLFERKSLSGNSAPRREAGQGTAGTISARTEGGGGLGTDYDLAGGLQAVGFGGGNRSGPIDKAACLTAKGQRIDFEVETFIAEKAGTLPAGGNRTGGDRPPGMGQETADTMLIAHSLRREGCDASEDGTGRGTPIVPVAFSTKDYGNDATDNLSPTMRSMGHDASHANGGGQLGVAYAIQAGALRENPDSGPDGIGVQEGGAYTLEARAEVQAVAWSIMPQNSGKDFKARAVDVAQPVMAGGPVGGNQGGDYIQQAWQVRRLTPTECERLQSFPDGFTDIEHRGKPAADGPRYKALGNSWARVNGEWIIGRIADRLATHPQGSET